VLGCPPEAEETHYVDAHGLSAFLSIVEKPEDRAAGRLTIRARVKGELGKH